MPSNQSINDAAATRLLISILFFSVTVIVIFWTHLWFEVLFLIGIVITYALPQFKLKSYLVDWLPFVIFFLVYEFMRGEVDDLSVRVHIDELINADRFLFGTVPTVALQRAWHVPGRVMWYDLLLEGFYLSHFLFPFFTAFWLWAFKRPLFRVYVRSFLAVAFIGLAGYYLYPAMPPWLASQQGYLPEVRRLIFDIPLSIGLPVKSLSLTYTLIGSNLIAAMPSLHAAWPLFISVFLVVWYRRRLWPLLIIPAGTWLAVVYLGEHYVIDVIAGIGVALIGLIVSWYMLKRVRT